MKKLALIIAVLAFLTFYPKIETHTSYDRFIPAPSEAQASEPQADRNHYIRTGMASWYSKQDPAINTYTANMEVFDDTAMTCAMWGVGFDQKIKVTNLDNGKSVVVRVNDRGPHERFVKEGRIIDLTKGAFAELSPNEKGLINVMIEYL